MYSRSDHDSGEPSLRSNKVELSRRWNKDDAVGDIEGGNQGHDEDPVIDPMMLKYMEMIRERRNNNPKVNFYLISNSFKLALSN